MASSWGQSWGTSWGSSWGAISGGDGTAALTNVSVTGIGGSFSAGLAHGISGVYVTEASGSLTAGLSQTAALAGVTITEASGSLGKSTTRGVSGITVTVAAGTLVSSGGTVFTMPVGQYRHVTAGPSQPGRPRRLKDLERVFQKWERKS